MKNEIVTIIRTLIETNPNLFILILIEIDVDLEYLISLLQIYDGSNPAPDGLYENLVDILYRIQDAYDNWDKTYLNSLFQNTEVNHKKTWDAIMYYVKFHRYR